MATKAPRSQFYQHRLIPLSALLSLAFILGWPPCATAQQDQEQEATRKIWELDGSVWRDDKIKGEPVVGVSFHQGFAGRVGLRDEDLKLLARFPHLRNIAALTTLRSLSFNGKLTTQGAKDLAKLQKLRELWAWDLVLTDDTTEHVGKLHNLTRLILHDAKISAAKAKQLATLTRLRRLHLHGRAWLFVQSDDALQALQKELPKCEISGNRNY